MEEELYKAAKELGFKIYTKEKVISKKYDRGEKSSLIVQVVLPFTEGLYPSVVELSTFYPVSTQEKLKAYISMMEEAVKELQALSKHYPTLLDRFYGVKTKRSEDD